MTQQEIKAKLATVKELLLEVLPAIKDENKDGKQFDYCTDGTLSDLVSTIEGKASHIHAIVFQGN